MRQLLRRLRHILLQRRFDAELADELDVHRQMKQRELEREGMPARAAARAAARALGNVTLAREDARAVWTWTWAQQLAGDVRHACRVLLKSPGLTVVAVVTLAAGIGVNAATFSVVNGVLLTPLAYPNPDRLVSIWHSTPGDAAPTAGVNLSPSMYFTYADENQAFQDIGIWTPGPMTVTGLAVPEEVRGVLVTHGVLQALSVQPALGRWLARSDHFPQAPSTLMLTYGYWQRRFGGDPSVVGRTIIVGSRPREIVGVMPDGFRFLDTDTDVIVPFGFDRRRLLLTGFAYNGVARLKPGMLIADANADVARMVPIWMHSWPGGDPSEITRWRITPAVRPLQQDVVGDISGALWTVMATTGIVMLIACANVANLLLVRGETRQQEFAVRTALGAGYGRIVREQLVEGIWLAVIGCALGLALAQVGLPVFLAAAPASLPRLDAISLDVRVLAFTVVLSLLSSLLFALIPAVKSARSTTPDALHNGGRSLTAGRARLRIRNALVAVQVALAVVLLVGAALMIRSFAALRNVEAGFREPSSLQMTRITVPSEMAQQPAQVARMQHAILDALVAIPGVTSVAFSSSMPLEGVDPPWEGLEAEGATASDSGNRLVRFKFVSPGLFQTMGTRLVVGRDFTWTDVHEGRLGVIVSANLARELWGAPAAAVGKRIRLGETPWRNVVGVAEDIHDNGVHAPAPTAVYSPVMVTDLFPTAPVFAARSVTFGIRSPRAGTSALLRDVEAAVWSVNKELALTSVRTMQDAYDRSIARTSFTLTMLTIAGTMALVLGIAGIYAVISFVVSQRRREIGIRLALGARPQELRRAFVRSGLGMSGVGIVIGVAAAMGLTDLLATLLFEISPLDPLTYIAVVLLLTIAAGLASYIPARRASAVPAAEVLAAD